MGAAPDRIDVGDLVVRVWEAADAEALHEAITDSLHHLRPWMPWIAHEPLGIGDRVALITQWERDRIAGEGTVYGVFRGDRVVGGTGLHERHPPDGIEIGYWVRAGETGRGVATVMARALTDRAFSVLDRDYVVIKNDKANVASGRVAQKLGYALVGEEPREVEAPGECGITQVWRLDRPTG